MTSDLWERIFPTSLSLPNAQCTNSSSLWAIELVFLRAFRHFSTGFVPHWMKSALSLLIFTPCNNYSYFVSCQLLFGISPSNLPPQSFQFHHFSHPVCCRCPECGGHLPQLRLWLVSTKHLWASGWWSLSFGSREAGRSSRRHTPTREDAESERCTNKVT